MDNYSESPRKKPRRKPKVVKEWKERDIFKLIALVEEESCLWNAAAEAYHNKKVRGYAWRKIAESFSFKYSASDLNAKWTNLRIQFRGYSGRVKTKLSLGEVEAPKWKYYNAMSFVGQNEDQKTQKRISDVVKIESESNFGDSDAPTTPPMPIHQQAKNLINRHQEIEFQTSQVTESRCEAVTAIKERRKHIFDPNTTFSNYLVSELQTLSREAAASVRKRVTVFFLECLEEERLADKYKGNLNETSH